MSSLTKNQQFLIRYVISNDMQRAKQMVNGVLAEDTTQKDAAFVSEMKERLARVQEIPLAYKGYLTGGYVSDEEMRRYFCSDREKAVAETIIRMSRAAEKLEELQIHYANATLLSGPSGCGKTMFVKYLICTLCLCENRRIRAGSMMSGLFVAASRTTLFGSVSRHCIREIVVLSKKAGQGFSHTCMGEELASE